MAKDDDLPKRIEAVFERAGLGNLDPEKLSLYLEQYDKAMSSADRFRNSSGKDFETILSEAPDIDFPEES